MGSLKIYGKGMGNQVIKGRACFDKIQNLCLARGFKVFGVPFAYDNGTPLYDVLYEYEGKRLPSHARIMELTMYISGIVECWNSL